MGRVVRRNQLTAFTRGELYSDRAAWLVFGIGLGALIALLASGCGSPTDGVAALGDLARQLAGRCDYDGAYTLTLTPIELGCGVPRVVQQDGREVGECAWTINGNPGRVLCDEDEHPVQRCDGETLSDDGCWHAVTYERTGP